MCVGQTGTRQQRGAPRRMVAVTFDTDSDIGRAKRRMCRTTRHEQHAVTGSLQRAHRSRQASAPGDQAVGGEPIAQPAAQPGYQELATTATHRPGKGLGQGIELHLEGDHTDQDTRPGHAEHAGAAPPQRSRPRGSPGRQVRIDRFQRCHPPRTTPRRAPRLRRVEQFERLDADHGRVEPVHQLHPAQHEPTRGEHGGIEHDHIDPVEPAQRPAVEYDDIACRELAPEPGGERIAPVARRFRHGGCHNATGTPGAERHDESGRCPGHTERPGDVRVSFQRPGTERCSARRQADCVKGLVVWRVAELRLAPLPRPTHRHELAELVGAVRDVGRQGERPLRQRLYEGTCDTEPEICESCPEVLLEEAPDPGLVLRQRHERAQLGGDGRRPQQLAEHTSAERNDVRPDGDRLPSHRLDVAGVLRPLVGETLLVDLVRLLHTLDDAEQVLGRGTLGIERHDDAAGDGVDLRPLHPWDGMQRSLHVAHQDLARGVVDSAHLDVSLALANPQPASSASRAQTVERAAQGRAGCCRALAQQPKGVHPPGFVGPVPLGKPWSGGRR